MHGTAPMAVRGRPANAVRSQNWSGYAAHGKTYKKISASWVEPTGHCTSSGTFSSFWVGLDGFTSRTVEQTGSEVDCRAGRGRQLDVLAIGPRDALTVVLHNGTPSGLIAAPPAVAEAAERGLRLTLGNQFGAILDDLLDLAGR